MDILAIIKEYLFIQHKISQLFLEKYRDHKDFTTLFSFPKKGELKVDGEIWVFRKHGLGFSFVNMCSGVVIDIHKHIEMPDLFDAHRISTYIESISKTDTGEYEIQSLIDEEFTKKRIKKHISERGTRYYTI